MIYRENLICEIGTYKVPANSPGSTILSFFSLTLSPLWAGVFLHALDLIPAHVLRASSQMSIFFLFSTSTFSLSSDPFLLALNMPNYLPLKNTNAFVHKSSLYSKSTSSYMSSYLSTHRLMFPKITYILWLKSPSSAQAQHPKPCLSASLKLFFLKSPKSVLELYLEYTPLIS